MKATGKHTEVFKQIAQLFGKLISDTDVFVNFIALDTFKYFAGVTKHIQIISFTAQINQKVEQTLKTYLQGKFPPDEVINPIDYGDYLEKLENVKFEHKCHKRIKLNNEIIMMENCDAANNRVSESNVIPGVCNVRKFEEKKNNELCIKKVREEILIVLEGLNSVVQKCVSVHAESNNSSSENSLCVLLSELKNCLETCKSIK